MQLERAAFGGVLVLVLLGLVGCGGEPMVSGTVKVDGQPLDEGTIQFTPVDGKAQTAGGSIKDGYYSVKVPVGTMKVEISKEKVVGYKKLYPTPDSPKMAVTKQALPAKYNDKTELQLDVKPGNNTKDWELQGK